MACAAVVMVALHGTSWAQEYLPPVIDRSIGAGHPAVQGRAGAAAPAAPSLEERVTRLEKKIDSQALVDMLMRLDTLQTENQALRGDLENLSHELEGLKQRQRDLYLDIDRRLNQVEQAANRPPAAAAPLAVPPSATVPAAAAAVGAAAAAGAVTTAAGTAVAPVTQERADPAKERDAYQKAFNTLKDGQYEQAITEFQTFLTQYPDGDYADNAQYWLGEANYATRRYSVAAQEFRKLLDKHPDSSKAADAMLKLGYADYELGEWDAARKVLTDVTNRYANSTAARLAESRLQKMRLEGH